VLPLNIPFIALALPQAWQDQGIALRPRRDDDAAFMRELFFSVRAPEFAVMGWSEPALRDFLAGQSRMQNRHYANVYPNAVNLVVTRHGTAIGRVILYPSPGDIRVVDIALLPQWRGSGLGTALLGAVTQQAKAARVSVSLSVDLHNPARRLYLRQGFLPVGDNGVAQEMRLPA
jgi:ribosomal protein S18 acetylase RimI-like enzyme